LKMGTLSRKTGENLKFQTAISCAFVSGNVIRGECPAISPRPPQGSGKVFQAGGRWVRPLLIDRSIDSGGLIVAQAARTDRAEPRERKEKRMITTRTENLNRFLAQVAKAGDILQAAEVAKSDPWHPKVSECLEKMAVQAMDTSSALSATGLADEFFSLFRSQSLFGRLMTRMVQVPFGVKMPLEAEGAAAFQWVPESGQRPALKLAFGDSLELEPRSIGGIVLISRELGRHSAPSAGETITRIVVSRTAAFVDASFVDPDSTAIDGQRPASILASAEEHVSTGSNAAAIGADLQALAALLENWRSPLFLMRPATLLSIAAAIPGAVQKTNGGTYLLGLPVETCGSIARVVALIDGGGILYADEGSTEIDVSREALIQAPDGASPEGLELISFWQENLIGFRIGREINWHATDGSAAYMEVAY
jgi:HK97 family phage major capsid protein